MPRVLPCSSLPRSAVAVLTTAVRRIMRSASAIRFAEREHEARSACSATASRPGPELLHTITPAAVHAVHVDHVVARTRRTHRRAGQGTGAAARAHRSTARPHLGLRASPDG